MRIVLLGDSHLARLDHDLDRIGGSGHEVANHAMGGSIAVDLAAQAVAADLRSDDTVVISIGTNDAAEWRPTEVETFEPTLATFLADLDVAHLVLVTSPGTDESRLGDTGPGFPPDQIATYAAAAGRLGRASGAAVVDAAVVLAPLGGRAFLDDGVHLAPDGYDVLLPVIAAAVSNTG